MKLALDLLRGDTARRLELLRRDANVFHVGAQHEVDLKLREFIGAVWDLLRVVSPHQVLVLLVNRLVLLFIFLVVRFEDCKTLRTL